MLTLIFEEKFKNTTFTGQLARLIKEAIENSNEFELPANSVTGTIDGMRIIAYQKFDERNYEISIKPIFSS